VELAEITLRELREFADDAAAMKVSDWEKVGQDGAEFVLAKIDKVLTHKVVQQLEKGPAFSAENAHPDLDSSILRP
jgi:hypothetical protein